MSATVREPVTVWLSRWREGQKDALEHIVPLVYDELRHVARQHLSREPARAASQRRHWSTRRTCACSNNER